MRCLLTLDCHVAGTGSAERCDIGARDHVELIGSNRGFDEMNDSEDRYRTIIDAIPAMAWSTLPDGYVEFLNLRWLCYTGLPLAEPAGLGGVVSCPHESL